MGGGGDRQTDRQTDTHTHTHTHRVGTAGVNLSPFRLPSGPALRGLVTLLGKGLSPGGC